MGMGIDGDIVVKFIIILVLMGITYYLGVISSAAYYQNRITVYTSILSKTMSKIIIQSLVDDGYLKEVYIDGEAHLIKLEDLADHE